MITRDVSARVVKVDSIDLVEAFPDLGEVEAKVRQHEWVLRTLLREEERELPFASQRFGGEVDARDISNTAAAGLGQPSRCPVELFPEVSHRSGHQGQTTGRTRARGHEVQAEGVRKVFE